MSQNQEAFYQKFYYKREFNTYINKLREGHEKEAMRFIQGAEMSQQKSRKKVVVNTQIKYGSQEIRNAFWNNKKKMERDEKI